MNHREDAIIDFHVDVDDKRIDVDKQLPVAVRDFRIRNRSKKAARERRRDIAVPTRPEGNGSARSESRPAEPATRLEPPSISVDSGAGEGDQRPAHFGKASVGVPRTFAITIIAQDPSVTVGGKPSDPILTSTVRVPAEFLEPGPRSHRFFVVDYDSTTGTAEKPVDLADNHGMFTEYFAREKTTDEQFRTSTEFRAQNVFAIAARTLSLFEFHLGRRVSWGFDSHQLHLVPNARLMANAYYDREQQAVLFGYCDDPDGRRVQTCLSHDIVAHEVTHAILDGLRPQYLAPSIPDQAALHEALADLVALLSVFELADALREALLMQLSSSEALSARATRRLPEAAVEPAALEDSVLWGIAEQLGKSAYGQRAVRYPHRSKPGDDWKRQPEYQEPHRRSEIIVAAVMRTLSTMWESRLASLRYGGYVDLDRAVEEGATAATHLMGMLIRGIDYLPPVDVEFIDVLDAVLVSDQVVNPDDPFRYRAAFEAGFGYFGINHIEQLIIDHTAASTPRPIYTNVNFNSLRCDRDEVFRFIWENDQLLNIDLEYRLFVSRVRAATRIGPDGFAVDEIVSEYTQELTLLAADLPKVRASHPDGLPDYANTPDGVPSPPVTTQSEPTSKLEPLRLKLVDGLDPTKSVRLVGGGTLIFDQFARLHFHSRKSLAWSNADVIRQQNRLDYLYGKDASPSTGLENLSAQAGAFLDGPEAELW